MGDPADSASPAEGSVEFVTYRLVRWATNAPYGVAYVAYDAPTERATAEARLAADLGAAGLTVDRLDLTAISAVPEAIQTLTEKIASTEADVLSVTGFAGFLRALGDDWTPFNYRREDWFQRDVRQVWWVPSAYDAAFARRAPDLYSWFLVRERLNTTSVTPKRDLASRQTSNFNREQARKRSQATLRRFDKAFTTQADLASLVGLVVEASRPLYEADQVADAGATVASMLDRLEYGGYGEQWRDPEPPDFLLEEKVRLASLCAQNADIAMARRALAMVDTDRLDRIPPSVQAEAFLALSTVAFRESVYTLAEEFARRAQRSYEALRQPVGLAHALRLLGDIELHVGRASASIELYARALSLYQGASDYLGQSVVLMRLADAANLLGDVSEAKRRYYESRLSYAALKDVHGVANVDLSLGELWLSQGRLVEAKKAFTQALEGFDEVQDSLGRANAMAGLGRVEAHLGNLSESRRLHEDALALYSAVSDAQGSANTLQHLVELDGYEGQYDLAFRRNNAALEIFQAIGEPIGQAATLSNLAEVSFALRRNDEVADYLSQAEALYSAAGNLLGKANVKNDRARLQFATGQKDEALANWREALIEYQALRNVEMIGRAHRSLADITKGEERGAHLAAARKVWEEAGRTDLLPLLDTVESDPAGA